MRGRLADGNAFINTERMFMVKQNGKKTMRAVMYYAPGDVRLAECPVPAMTPDAILVKVACCAICGTDLKLATVGNPRCHPPRIIGHEMAGRIVDIGASVRGFAAGERVTLATTLACGACAICRKGLGNLCPASKPISYNYDGAFAEYLLVPPDALRGGNLIRIPEGISDEAAALSEPLSCAVNAQVLANVSAGDNVLILGGGPLGAIHAELAKARGARRVMIVQRSEPRLSLLRRLAAVHVIDGNRDDIASIVKEQTGGLGADVVIVCAPARRVQEDAPALVRKGGCISLFAGLPKGESEITLDSRVLHYNEIRIVGASDSRPEHVVAALKLLAAGKINTDALITHRLPLERFMEGIALMKQKQSLKVLIDITQAMPQ